MSNARGLLAVILGCSLLLVGRLRERQRLFHPSGQPPSQARAHTAGPDNAGGNARTLRIETIQSDPDRSSPCFIHYSTRVLKQTPRVIRIELLEPDPQAQPFRCPAIAAGGPFFVPVHLKAPYRGQRLVDPVTGRAHRLTRRSDL